MSEDKKQQNLLPFGEMTLRTSVRIGVCQTTVGALAALEPGTVIKLETPLGSPFELVVEGVAIATVEPVAADERVGVKLIAALPGGKR